MNGTLDWIAAIGTMIAAGLIAADLGRRATGWGFVLFVAVAITWIVAAMTASPPAWPLAVMNGILMCINAWGVWQYLLNPRRKRELELAEQCAAQAKQDIENDEAAASSP